MPVNSTSFGRNEVIAPDTQMRVFVVVPAYNEARAMPAVLSELEPHCENIVIVDDGSSDGTSRAAQGFGATILRHVINRGQGAALQTGIEYSLAQGANVIITFDADGQHDAADIRRLAEPIIRRECDVTLGSRFLGRAERLPLQRKLILKAGIIFTYLLSGLRLSDVHNGLRGFSRRAAADLKIPMDRMAHASWILDRVKAGGWHYREVGVTVRYSQYSRDKGQSSWNSVRIALQMIAEKLR
jgi:glycosyltransferase involved in cell wall biosynthesis